MLELASAASKREHRVQASRSLAYGHAAAYAVVSALACGQGQRDVTDLYAALPSDSMSVQGAPSTEGFTATQTPVVFTSDRAEEGVLDVYVMALDGTGVRRLTWGGDHYWPQWAPDGGGIAFRTGGQSAEVGVLASDGGPPILLTQGEASHNWQMPVNWSADSQWLAFSSRLAAGGPRFVSVISRSGGQQRRLLPNIDVEQDTAVWSWVNGSRIVYSEFGGERNKDLWLIEAADSTQALNLTQGRVFAPGHPQWSRDGSRIAFHAYPLSADGSLEGLGSHAEGGATPPDPEIFLIDIESQELTRVTDNSWHDYRPVWSPDGSSLLIESAADGDSDLWLMPLDAPELARNLVDDSDLPREDANPAWYWGPL